MLNLTWARVQYLCTYCGCYIIYVLNANYQILTCCLSCGQVDRIPYIAVSYNGCWYTPYISLGVLALLFLYYLWLIYGNFNVNFIGITYYRC